jgi:hypothetical protein
MCNDDEAGSKISSVMLRVSPTNQSHREAGHHSPLHGKLEHERVGGRATIPEPKGNGSTSP